MVESEAYVPKKGDFVTVLTNREAAFEVVEVHWSRRSADLDMIGSGYHKPDVPWGMLTLLMGSTDRTKISTAISQSRTWRR